MVELARILALLAFVALAIAIVVFARRLGRAVAETRSRQSFRRAAADLVSRACTSLDGVAERIDAVRRQTLDAHLVTDNLEAASEAVRRYTEEAEALAGATGEAREVRDGILTELKRAGRALQLAKHGVTIMTSAARIRGRELEAQTSIKRGYLGLLHAREALVRHGARADELVTLAQPQWFARRNA
jgi:hypothetical protein